LIDISKTLVEQNFDEPEKFMKFLNSLELQKEQSKSLISILCSGKVLKA
jgi:hypothetical protein